MRQTIVLNEQWFECVEAIAAIQQVKEELEHAVQEQSSEDLADHIIEICDINIVEALSRCCKALIRASRTEAYIESDWSKSKKRKR